MDVRCDKCGTEYELDESQLKPGGVTVKCTTCDHLFKVRKRKHTVVGVPAVTGQTPSGRTRIPGGPAGNRERKDDTAPGRVAKAGSTRPAGRSTPSTTPGGRSKERKWMIRLPTGQIETCRELSTLQQWIISGRVSRGSGISRTGNTWKKLGDIKDLAKFFEIADEARQARREREIARNTPSPSGEPRTTPEPTPPPSRQAPMTPPGADAIAAGSPDAQVAAPRSSSPSPAPPQADPNTATELPSVTSSPAPSSSHSGDWGPASGGVAASSSLAGLAGKVKTQDVAFASSKIAPIRDDLGIPDDDFDEFRPPRRGVGRWIVAISLLLMAGAAAVVYLLVFRGPGDKTTDQPELAAAAADAGAQAAVASDAGAAVVPPPTADSKADILAAAGQNLLGNNRSELETTEGQLAGLADTDADIAVLLARAGIHTAIAQHIQDELALSDDAKKNKELTRQADKRVLGALTLTKKALKLEKDNPAANALMADVLRLQKKRARDVERYLKKVLKKDRKNREALLVRGLLYARDKKEKKARKLLGQLGSGDGAIDKSGDVRPVYRLAFMDVQAEKYQDAKHRIDEILTAKPGHSGAMALRARIRAATAVDTSDPLPPEDDGQGGNSGRSYDSLLVQARKKAENDDCRAAMKLYERALDARPSGVEALSGMGYCHIDLGQYASAHGKFKAALGVSPRYQDALWGVGEAYMQQGLKDQAIKAFQRFISEHPNSRRADMAKKHIERLGGKPDGSGDTKPPDGDTKPPDGDTKPPDGDTKPPDGDTKPPDGDTKPPDGDTKPPDGDTKPAGGDTEKPKEDPKKDPAGSGDPKPGGGDKPDPPKTDPPG